MREEEVMTEKAIRQDISNAEKALRRLEKQHGQLQRLASDTAGRLAKINPDADPTTLMEARIRRDAARDMLAENEGEQQATRDRIQELTAQAETSSLEEAAARAVEALEAAKGEWRKSAAAAARAFLAAMEDLEAKQARITDAYSRASAAAHAAHGNDEGITANVNWQGLPGVTPHGMISTENMSMQPPMFKTQLAAMTIAMNNAPRIEPVVRGEGRRDPHGGFRSNNSDVIPDDRPTFSLKTMGLVK